MKKMVAMVLVLLLVASTAGAESAIFPVALVNVNLESWLNVRKTPGGELTFTRLVSQKDVVILDEVDGWALVNTIERMEDGKPPLGWSSSMYLVKYRAYIVTKKTLVPGTQEP